MWTVYGSTNKPVFGTVFVVSNLSRVPLQNNMKRKIINIFTQFDKVKNQD